MNVLHRFVAKVRTDFTTNSGGLGPGLVWHNHTIRDAVTSQAELLRNDPSKLSRLVVEINRQRLPLNGAPIDGKDVPDALIHIVVNAVTLYIVTNDQPMVDEQRRRAHWPTAA